MSCSDFACLFKFASSVGFLNNSSFDDVDSSGYIELIDNCNAALKLKFFVHVPIIIKYIFYTVTKKLSFCPQKVIMAFEMLNRITCYLTGLQKKQPSHFKENQMVPHL